MHSLTKKHLNQAQAENKTLADQATSERISLRQREKDIEALQITLRELRETLQLESDNRKREYESLIDNYETVCAQNQALSDKIDQ
jgi:hypothetical protein